MTGNLADFRRLERNPNNLSIDSLTGWEPAELFDWNTQRYAEQTWKPILKKDLIVHCWIAAYALHTQSNRPSKQTAGWKMSFQSDKLFVRDFERRDGSILKINQSEIGDVGCVVWDAAMVLAAFLETPEVAESLVGRRCVELGAGTGLVGLQAACGGASCEITDLPEFVPLIQLNIDTNSQLTRGKVSARPLTWGKDVDVFLPPPDYVLLADCIYYPESIEPLVETIARLAGANTTIYCCYEERTTDNKPMLQKQFFELMSVHFLNEKIPLERQDPTWQSEDIHIHRFWRR